MNPNEQPDTGASRPAQEKPDSESFIKELGRGVGKGLLRETGATIKWAVGGAVLGALVAGGFGLWKFGITGMGIGAIAGAVIGGAAGGWAYISV